MTSNRIMMVALVVLLTGPKAVPAADQDADQQINDFSLSGYSEGGEKTWDLSGTTADIFAETVALDNVIGKLYGQDENITLTADEGDFDRHNGTVTLRKDVIISTTGGARLTTDSLSWDRKDQVVSTEDKVNVARDNIKVAAKGAEGQPNLQKVSLKKDVQLDILPAPDTQASGAVKEKTTITCDGPLEIDYQANVATFKNNVQVKRADSTIYSDTMEVHFLTKGASHDAASKNAADAFGDSKIDRIIARGNVRVVRGENVSYSEEAIYTASDRKIVLRGRPKLVIVSTEELDASSGN